MKPRMKTGGANLWQEKFHHNWTVHLVYGKDFVKGDNKDRNPKGKDGQI